MRAFPVLILCLWLISGELLAASPVRQGADLLPRGVRRIVDVSYGPDPLQSFDVYLPAEAASGKAPILLMVHGGGWRRGDKQTRDVVGAKAAWWVPRGYLLVSTNYRMLPSADPLEQARDVARALRRVQQLAPTWNGDPDKVVLMGHSAGGHLVALLAASPAVAEQAGAAPFLGAVALDSGAMDVVRIMQGPHLPLFDDAFGTRKALWRAASPHAQLSSASKPLLATCSTRRQGACADAERLAARARTVKAQVDVVRVDKSHMQANADVGVDVVYTSRIDAFLRQLVARWEDPGLMP